jgi:hypothetical protein
VIALSDAPPTQELNRLRSSASVEPLGEALFRRRLIRLAASSVFANDVSIFRTGPDLANPKGHAP